MAFVIQSNMPKGQDGRGMSLRKVGTGFSAVNTFILAKEVTHSYSFMSGCTMGCVGALMALLCVVMMFGCGIFVLNSGLSAFCSICFVCMGGLLGAYMGNLSGRREVEGLVKRFLVRR